MNNKVIIAIVVLVLLVGGGFFYFQSQSQQNSTTNETAEDSVMEDVQDTMTETAPGAEMSSPSTGSAAMESEDGVKEIVVEGSNFKFAPNNITVNKGDKVKVVFKNVGGMPHDFTIDELDVKSKTITVGNTDTVEFTADKAGSYEFYCSVGQHRANGMKGTLTVK